MSTIHNYRINLHTFLENKLYKWVVFKGFAHTDRVCLLVSWADTSAQVKGGWNSAKSKSHEIPCGLKAVKNNTYSL